MLSSLSSTGNDPSQPYVLAVASHKGGTGRTTAALALAWCWGQSGLQTLLVDADPVPAARLVATGPDGRCPWPNVRILPTLPKSGESMPRADLIVVDCPPLTEPGARQVLRRADGVLLTTQTELLALRTTPSATYALQVAQAERPNLELVGMIVAAFDVLDPLHNEMLAQLRSLSGELLLEPVIPLRPELREWPLWPGSDVPGGPGRQAYQDLAKTVYRRLGVRVRS